MLHLNCPCSACELDALTTKNESLIRLAFRARNKLGLRGVTDLKNAVGHGVTRQLIYRTLTAEELKEFSK